MTKKIYADLHNHTIFSDGELSPEKMVIKAKNIGLKAIAITDHDTINGLKEAVEAGKKHNIKVVPGVEISIRFNYSFFTGTLHLLCYFSPKILKNNNFRNLLKNNLSKGRGDNLVKIRIEKINKFFGPKGTTPIFLKNITFNEISKYGTNITRRHFALALREKHKIKHEKIINKIIGNKSCAYYPAGIDLKAVQNFIKKFPVVTVLAHSAAGSFPGNSHYKEVHPDIKIIEKILPELLEFGIDGLEINYPGHTKKHRKFLLNWAEKYNLIVTGGSDCHDTLNRPLGIEGISKHEFDKFMNFLTLKTN
ncbi:MAG: phosphatase [Desulfobacteraceae bacterium 4572_130]|nr:MAG: phosphatase [Desulfobacteraceae bacterium 4572_130]